MEQKHFISRQVSVENICWVAHDCEAPPVAVSNPTTVKKQEVSVIRPLALYLLNAQLIQLIASCGVEQVV